MVYLREEYDFFYYWELREINPHIQSLASNPVAFREKRELLKKIGIEKVISEISTTSDGNILTTKRKISTPEICEILPNIRLEISNYMKLYEREFQADESNLLKGVTKEMRARCPIIPNKVMEQKGASGRQLSLGL